MVEATLIGVAVALLLMLAFLLRGSGSSSGGDAAEGKRFVLRVKVPGSRDDEPMRIGTSVELGEVPSSEPTLTSVDAIVEDDADQLVAVPAGILLLVRQFDGALRVPRAAVTSSAGTGRRFTFEVPPDLRFWILDAPGWRECLSTTDPKVRRLPPRAEGYEITTRLPPAPAIDEAGKVGVTMANLVMPIWMHGLEGPSGWLAGERPPEDEVGVAIASFTDPFSGTGMTERDATVGSAAFVLADAVWLETSARATVGLPIVVSRARVFTTEGLREWADLGSWKESFGPSCLIAWGAARESLETEGYDLRLRSAAETTEQELDGTIGSLRAELVRVVQARGLPARTQGSGVCDPIEPIPEELEGAYVAVCDLLILLILSHPKNQALPSQEPQVMRKIVELARQLSEAAPASHVAVLTWVVAAIYAHGCGGIGSEQRDLVIDFVAARARDAPASDPIRRLTPAILYRLGDMGAARNACRGALAEKPPSGYRGKTSSSWQAYRAWLGDLDALIDA